MRKQGDCRRQMWVSPEFHAWVQRKARETKEDYRLRKKPSSVDITHKLAKELKGDSKPIRFQFMK